MSQPAVVEMLTFRVPVGERAAWLDVEERTWSRFLERQDGFVRKEMWADRNDPDLLHAVIWWSDETLWKSIPADELAAVDAAMGPWFRECTLTVFDVAREG